MTWVAIPGGLGQTEGDRVNDIAVVGSQVWAVCASGTILQWTEGDAQTTATSVTGQTRCIGMAPGGMVGWIGMLTAGDGSSRLKKTVDGGTSWQDVEGLPVDSSRGLCGMSVLDETTAFACGTFDRKTAPGLWQTQDGVSWTGVALPDGITNLIDVSFWDAKHGMVVGGTSKGPVILLTADGGGTFAPATLTGQLPASSYCWKIFFVDDALGFVSVADSGKHPLFLATKDGGITFTTVQLDVHDFDNTWNLQGIGFADAQHGWVGQEGGPTFETDDGGASWSSIGALADFNRMRVTTAGAFAGGDALYRLASAGGSWKAGATTRSHLAGSRMPHSARRR
jgi:photosystem II stability/assembly factor-like uncharacterized protein